jgi:glyoxylase-like metal-dependent hydrolase (beta-lactamase superfamily II)
VAVPTLPAEPGYEIEEGLHTIGPLKRGWTVGGYSRAYLFEEGDELTLVDTLYQDDAHFVIDYLWSIGRSPSDLTNIVLTHSHRSHIGGAARLRELSGAPVSCHVTEARVIEGYEGLPPVNWTPLRPLVLVPFRVLSHLHVPKHVPCIVDRTIIEGDRFGKSLEVLYVPGHTPGSLALRWRKRVLIVADAVLTWPSFGPGWPGFNLDERQFRRQLARLVNMNPEIVCPGHGLPIVEHTSERLAMLMVHPPD